MIIGVHFPDLGRETTDACIKTFYGLRKLDGIEKKPATRELINWIRALKADPDFKLSLLEKGNVPYLGVLYKKSPDMKVANGAIARHR